MIDGSADEAVATIAAVTGADAETAAHLLDAAGGDIDAAVGLFLEGGGGGGGGGRGGGIGGRLGGIGAGGGATGAAAGTAAAARGADDDRFSLNFSLGRKKPEPSPKKKQCPTHAPRDARPPRPGHR